MYFSVLTMSQGSPEPLGRAFAEPELKFVEEPYKKPVLKFFDISRGKSSAGELLAAFELIELDYSRFGEVRHLKHSFLMEIARSEALLYKENNIASE